MRLHHLVVATLLTAGLAGCGGSAGGDGSAAAAGATPPAGAHGQLLGSRSVPGGMVTVSSSGPLQPGSDNVFRLTLSLDMPTPSAVAAWIGIAYDPAATGIPATPVATTPGSYDVAIPVPSPVAAASHVWVRLTFSDGSVVETGSEDFMLAGH